MKFGVVRFPGSNCDQDAYYVLKDVMQVPVEYIWHQQTTVKGFDCIVLPGGFSFGDYLRTGAIARFSPVMDAVIAHANRGGYVFGVCNGFQVLCESGLLPGALVRNNGLRFRCRQVQLKVENTDTAFTRSCRRGQVLTIPIAHGEGCYVADTEMVERLLGEGRALVRYCNDKGELTEEANPNGSAANIAGVMNEGGNVFGMMPHPERAAEHILGSADGRQIFHSLVTSVRLKA